MRQFVCALFHHVPMSSWVALQKWHEFKQRRRVIFRFLKPAHLYACTFTVLIADLILLIVRYVG